MPTLKMPLTIPNLGAVALSMRGSLELVLDALCDVHDWKLGPWFDDLRAACIRNAKSHIPEGINLDDEVETIGFGVQVVEMIFEGYAKKLAPLNDG